SLAQNIHLLLHACRVGSAAQVSGFPRHLQIMSGQGSADAFPAVAAVGVDLVEDRHTLAADLHKMINQSGSLLIIRGPQVKGEFTIRLLPLRFGAGERKEEEDRLILIPLQ